MSELNTERLDSLAKQINTELDTGDKARLEHYYRAGQCLIEAKAAFGEHGHWTSWLEDNCPGLSQRKAQRLMALAKCDVTSDLKSQWREICGNSDVTDEGEKDGSDAPAPWSPMEGHFHRYRPRGARKDIDVEVTKVFSNTCNVKNVADGTTIEAVAWDDLDPSKKGNNENKSGPESESCETESGGKESKGKGKRGTNTDKGDPSGEVVPVTLTKRQFKGFRSKLDRLREEFKTANDSATIREAVNRCYKEVAHA